MHLSLNGLWYIWLCFKDETFIHYPDAKKWVQLMYWSIPKQPISPPPPPPPPPSIWLEFCTVQWRIWPKIRPAQFVIWLSCQYRKQRDFVILSTFSMCTTFMGQCSFTIFLVHLQGFEKNMSDVGFMEWNEQTYVGQLSETLDILIVSCRLFTFWKKCLMH